MDRTTHPDQMSTGMAAVIGMVAMVLYRHVISRLDVAGDLVQYILGMRVGMRIRQVDMRAPRQSTERDQHCEHSTASTALSGSRYLAWRMRMTAEC